MHKIVLILMWLTYYHAYTQGLPAEMYYSPDGRTLYTGGKTASGVYDRNLIREVYLDFPQPNYWTLLTNNYASETEIPATMTVDGITYDSVGVRFRGNTSYFQIGNSQKKSFAISTDLIHADQTFMGYNNLKFNNAHQDASFMREVLYCRMAARHTPIAKTNYIHLYLNNQDWGIYPNIQAIDKTFLEQYFLSNDGARFRATTEETGPGGGGGAGWGDGTAGMNYLGSDTSTYKEYYELKSSDIENPWQKLIDACQVLSAATAANMDVVRAKIDIDKALWFLAVENIFADDDSYIMKGKMDYYVYYEPETDRTTPLEYDGNSSFLTNAATSSNWGPFKNVTNANYPLLNKLLNIPEWRQRYLAHYRTILTETFTSENANAQIDSIDAQIRDLVNADTKKLYTYAQYTSGVPALKSFVSSRRNFLLSNAEVAQASPTIESAPYLNSDFTAYEPPTENETVHIQSTVTSTNGINKVNLYYATGLTGNFTVTSMFDDGLHEDGFEGDGVYGAVIPGFPSNTMVRYYIEAIANNAAHSASYLPTGAEHDVFVYQVSENQNMNGVVINEILASNSTGAVDEAGDHEDWIELFNTNDFEVDLSEFYLTDKINEPDQWQIPAGTVIPAQGYLIIWADEETEEGAHHASFKLSAGGEAVLLSDPSLNLVDLAEYGAQTTDLAYARVPNGTGGFIIQEPTFNASNNIQLVTSGVVVNEILAINSAGATDETGDHEGWIEIYNNNAFDVDLSGFYLTDKASEPAQWQIPAGTIIPALGYLMVWADEETGEGPLHADFKLSAGGEAVIFSDTSLFVLDSVVYGAQTADLAYARVPNGTGGFLIQETTFNATNNIQPVTSGVVVNEILASNSAGATDEVGDHEDWIELYNNNAFEVDLSGFYLTDKVSEPTQWQIPAGTIIPALGYLMVWADEETEEGSLHTNFKLSAGGEVVILSDTSLFVLDSVGFGAQTADLAYARLPNGTGDFIIQAPTFNNNNENSTSAETEISEHLITLYPNPFEDRIWLRLNVEGSDHDYNIVDQLGRIVHAGKLTSDISMIVLDQLPTGMYFLRIPGEKAAMIKLIKR